MDVEQLWSGPPGTSTVWEALADLVSAGQEAVADRIDLLRSEVTEDLEELALSSGILLAAGFVAAAGWVALAGALVGWLGARLDFEAALAIVGLVHVVAGVALFGVAVRRFGRQRSRDGIRHSPFAETVDA